MVERRKIKQKEKHANEIKTQQEEIQDLKRKMQKLILQTNNELDEVNSRTIKQNQPQRDMINCQRNLNRI